MRRDEFDIGTWLCTDIGTRVVVAVHVSPEVEADVSWPSGPPYAIAEKVFDEDDMKGCSRMTRASIDHWQLPSVPRGYRLFR
jgi:hypothetical protein